MTPEVETISWRDLTGNKYLKSLHPAMLTERGYVSQQLVRRTGDAAKNIFNVVYDHEYLVEYTSRFLCRNLFMLGKEGVLDLVSEAWDYKYPNYTLEPTHKLVKQNGN